jgi:hypothetical protein
MRTFLGGPNAIFSNKNIVENGCRCSGDQQSRIASTLASALCNDVS